MKRLLYLGPFFSEQTREFEVHRQLHTDAAPFKCSHCPKSFAQKANLKVGLSSASSRFWLPETNGGVFGRRTWGATGRGC